MRWRSVPTTCLGLPYICRETARGGARGVNVGIYGSPISRVWDLGSSRVIQERKTPPVDAVKTCDPPPFFILRVGIRVASVGASIWVRSCQVDE